MSRGVDPVLKVGGRGTNLYTHMYAYYIYIYMYIYICHIIYYNISYILYHVYYSIYIYMYIYTYIYMTRNTHKYFFSIQNIINCWSGANSQLKKPLCYAIYNSYVGNIYLANPNH